MASSDPSRTTGLRNKLMSRFNSQYTSLNNRIQQIVVENDVFGFDTNTPFSSGNSVGVFRQWVEQQLVEIQGYDNREWLNQSVSEFYNRGIARAVRESNKRNLVKMRPEDVGVSLRSIGLFEQRVNTALDSINAAVVGRLVGAVADTLGAGASISEAGSLFRSIIDGVGKNRSYALTQYEMLKVFNEASLDAYELMGIETLGVIVESVTAKDSRVCPLCVSQEGLSLTIKEARGRYPLHVRCRCITVPKALKRDAGPRRESPVNRFTDRFIQRQQSRILS